MLRLSGDHRSDSPNEASSGLTESCAMEDHPTGSVRPSHDQGIDGRDAQARLDVGDPLAVGRPGRHRSGRRAPRDRRSGRRAVDVHDPDLVGPIGVRAEGDRAGVRRPGRRCERIEPERHPVEDRMRVRSVGVRDEDVERAAAGIGWSAGPGTEGGSSRRAACRPVRTSAGARCRRPAVAAEFSPLASAR